MQFASLVTRTQLVLGVALMGSSLALAAACSSTTNTGTGDGGTGTSGGTSGATSGGTSGGTSGATSGGTSGGGVVGGSKCSGSSGTSTSTCTQAETDSYNSCITSMCDAEYQAALGAGYKTGSFGGACGTYITCTQACGCSDTACFMKCGQPDAACTTALTNSSTCAQTKCPPPACLTAGKDAGTSGTSGTSGGTHTCADLKACCAGIADANTKMGCDAAATATTDPATCNTYYDAFKSSCP